MKLRDAIAFVQMWLLVVFLLIFMEFVFQLSKFSFLSGMALWTLVRVFFNSVFLLSLPCIVIIGFLYVLAFAFQNIRFLNQAITKALLFSLSFAFVFVCFLHLVTWIYSVYKVSPHELSTDGRRLVWVLLIVFSYLIYRYRSYSVHSYLSRHYRYPLFILGLCIFVGLTSIVFNYSQYAHTPQISGAKIQKDLPNIILFCSDGLNPEHMSVYGYERDTTPNLRELAKSSAVFHRAYFNITTSRGSHVSVLTGKYPVTTKVIQQMNILQGVDSFQHLPGILKSLGYYNIDTGPVTQTVPTAINLRNGFDEVNNRKTPLIFGQLFLDNRLIKIFNVEIYLFYRIVNRFLERWGIRTIKGLSDRGMIGTVRTALKAVDAPIFAHLHLLETHPHPRTKTYDPFLRKFSKGKEQVLLDIDFYDDAIYSMDYYLGELVQALKENNKFDNTLIVFFSDHGMELISSHIISVLPLIVKFPGESRPTSCSLPVQYIDIAPSILKLLGISIPKWMEGEPFLVDYNSIKPEAYNNRPIFTFSELPGHPRIEAANIITDNYYLTFHLFPPDITLYDTRSSPYTFTEIHDDKLTQKYLGLLISFLSNKGVELPDIEKRLEVIAEDYLGFKIIFDNDRRLYYGLQHPQTQYIRGKTHLKDHRRLFQGSTTNSIRSKITRYHLAMKKTREDKIKIARAEGIYRPRLVGGYKGFNIVNYKGVFYGVDRAEGPLDIRVIRTKSQRLWVSGESVEQVRSKINELLASTESLKSNKGKDD